MAAIQGIQLKILTASQVSGPPRTQDRAQRGPGAARGRGHGPPRPRKCRHPPWNPASCGCGGRTSSPPMARRVTDASLAPGWRTTGGPGTRSSTYRARAAVALGVFPGRADPGSNGTRQRRPDGGAKGRVATSSQVQFRPTRWQMALHEVRTPLRTLLRPPHEAVYGGASLPGSSPGHH